MEMMIPYFSTCFVSSLSGVYISSKPKTKKALALCFCIQCESHRIFSSYCAALILPVPNNKETMMFLYYFGSATPQTTDELHRDICILLLLQFVTYLKADTVVFRISSLKPWILYILLYLLAVKRFTLLWSFSVS